MTLVATILRLWPPFSALLAPVPSVHAAVAARFAASAGLQAALPGGLAAGRHRSDPVGVYGNFNLISNAVSWTTEDGCYHEAGRVQFSVFGPALESVDAAARALCTHDPDGFDRLSGVPLDDGTVVVARRVAGPVGPLLDASKGPGAARVWMATIDYLFEVSRNL